MFCQCLDLDCYVYKNICKLQSRWLLLQNLFIFTGMYPLNRYLHLSQDIYWKVWNYFENFSKSLDLFTDVKLTDENLNDIGVDSLIKIKNYKDKHVLPRQRAVLLTNLKIGKQIKFNSKKMQQPKIWQVIPYHLLE